MLLIVHHCGEHQSASPARCRCAERTRVAPADSALTPSDQHAFVSEAARERYERMDVDPRCQREHAEDVERRNVAAMGQTHAGYKAFYETVMPGVMSRLWEGVGTTLHASEVIRTGCPANMWTGRRAGR